MTTNESAVYERRDFESITPIHLLMELLFILMVILCGGISLAYKRRSTRQLTSLRDERQNEEVSPSA